MRHPSPLLSIASLLVVASTISALDAQGSAGSPTPPVVVDETGSDVRRVVVDDMVIDFVGDLADATVAIPGVEPPSAGERPAGDAGEGARYEAIDGEAEGTPHHAPASGGYTLFSETARWLRSGYTIRLTGSDGRIDALRPQLAAVAAAAEAIGGLPVRVAAGVGGPVDPARGEIVVVLGTGPCGAGASGCGGPALSSTEVISGRIWISPHALGMTEVRRANLVAHELGHALGLHHHSPAWTDGIQVMHPRNQGIRTYRAGDAAGLRHVAGRNDRPAGGLSSLVYAAGRVHASGPLVSGTRVRLASGRTTAEARGGNGRFDGMLPLPAGVHEVCATSLDAAPGHLRALGCGLVEAPGRPRGAFEGAVGSFETIRVRGWAIDPQTPNAVTVEVRRNGAVVASVPASAHRPDLDPAIQAHYGPAHGYSIDVPAVAGRNRLCVRVVGVGGGGDLDQGCRDVHHDVDPIGALESVQVDGTTVRVTGWALDPNTPAAVEVRGDLGGTVPTVPGSFDASTARPDIAAAYPAHGQLHGFDRELTLPPGEHRLCLTITNVGLGRDHVLRCRDVVIDPAPTALDVVKDPSATVGGALDTVAATAAPTLGRTGR